MATVLLITAAVGNTATNRVEAAIEGASSGHVVTQVDHDDVASGAQSVTGHDIVVSYRCQRNSTYAGKLRIAVQAGKGLAILADANPDGTQTPNLNHMGLMTASSVISVTNGGNAIVVSDDSHPITAGMTEGVQTAVFAGNTKAHVLNDSPSGGIDLATGDPDVAAMSGKRILVAIPEGSAYVAGASENTGANIVFWGGAPESFDYTTAGADMLRRIIVWLIGNESPVVTITDPPDASSFTEGDPITFEATASDAEDGDISADVAWESDLDGALGTGASIEVSTLSVGTHEITASVEDSGSASGSDSITVTINAPVAPSITIDAPADNSLFLDGVTVSFEGTATDADDGDISADIEWSSDLDGALGTGATLDVSSLSPGTHVITASITDSDDLTATAIITVTIIALSFSASAFGGACDPLAAVYWTPVGAESGGS